MTVWIESMEALCQIPGTPVLPLGLFLAGLAGSITHCGPMCGPFVLGQAADRMARIPASRMCEASRLGGALLLPYHAGRLASYATLGALAGTGGLVLPTGLVGGFLALAAMLFALQAFRRFLPGLRGFGRSPQWWQATIGRLAARINRRHWTGELLLGSALGFLPCGMLYAALLSTAASGGAWRGGVAMLAFGLGTVPALILVALAGQAAGRRWQRGMAVAAPAVMLLNAVLLAGLAVAFVR